MHGTGEELLADEQGAKGISRRRGIKSPLLVHIDIANRGVAIEALLC